MALTSEMKRIARRIVENHLDDDLRYSYRYSDSDIDDYSDEEFADILDEANSLLRDVWRGF
ncbi:hypothetical protein ACFRAQ_34635 [Nocardia sp. NPDC056611]|uniref:hypothetical protein n=1 Tax=Nocardia sp. NPDC056611 TaxID=3345877 RepID=UPI00367069B0